MRTSRTAGRMLGIGLVAIVGLGTAGCGGGSSSSNAAKATAEPSETSETPQSSEPSETSAAAGDCGVTIDDVQALAPAKVKVQPKEVSADDVGACEYVWIGQSSRMGDPSRVHIARNPSGAKDFASAVEDGLYGPMDDVDGVGDRAWVSNDGTQTVQLIATKGNAVVNIQVRNFDDRDQAETVAKRLAKAAL